jgi:hypothetical protein
LAEDVRQLELFEKAQQEDVIPDWVWAMAGSLASGQVKKFNPHHDELGRFTSGPGGGLSPAAKGAWSEAVPKAELVPIEFFDDMPSWNVGAARAGDVDTGQWSHRVKPEYADKIRSFENFDELVDDMAKRGLDEPLQVIFNSKTGDVLLSEGNHRLAAARTLGWDSVPVIMQRSQLTPAELGAKGSKIIPISAQPAVGFSSNPSPSQVGVPTQVSKFNPNHDELGRFSSGPGGGISQEVQDANFKEEYGQERLDGDGDCYPTANSLAMQLGRDEEKYPNLKVAHGVPMGPEGSPIEGIRFGHGWVEYDDPDTGLTMVIDRSNGNDVEMPAFQYYYLGSIEEWNVNTYTPQEVIKHQIRTRHHGPWE